MKRTRWAAPAAVGLSCLLLTVPAQAESGAAPAGTAPSERPAAATAVPLTADELVTTTVVDGQGRRQATETAGRLYRDSKGRIRHEVGSTVTISDPAAGTTIRLDARNRTFQRSARTAGAAAPNARPGMSTLPPESRPAAVPPRSLGTAVVQGVRAAGSVRTVTTPRFRTVPARTREITTWVAAEVQLVVQTQVTGAAGAEYTQTYRNIRAGVEPAASLFTVPAGYREAAPAAAPTPGAVTAAEGCPVGISPNPLALVSVGSFYASGFITASTDPNAGCAMVFGAPLYAEFPINGAPLTPLGLPFDTWQIWDDPFLPCCPFFPWTSFAVMGWIAYNGTDSAPGEGLIILNIF